MRRKELTNLTNKELDKLLDKADWCDKTLLREYDERRHDGRIKMGKPMTISDLEEHFRKRREEKEKKKAS